MPAEGAAAPSFRLPADDREVISLHDFAGKKHVVLYFYPKDNTPGCTTEACEFRDLAAGFERANTVVIGVSPDDVSSHGRFRKKWDLNFSLASDVDHDTAETYGVWVEKNLYGRRYMGVQRATFLIDRAGKVARVWPKVSVKGHAKEVLAAAKDLG